MAGDFKPYTPPVGSSVLLDLSSTYYTPPTGNDISFTLLNPSYFNINTNVKIKYGVQVGGNLYIPNAIRQKTEGGLIGRYKLRDRWIVDYDYFIGNDVINNREIAGHIVIKQQTSLHPRFTITGRCSPVSYSVLPKILIYKDQSFICTTSITGVAASLSYNIEPHTISIIYKDLACNLVNFGSGFLIRYNVEPHKITTNELSTLNDFQNLYKQINNQSWIYGKVVTTKQVLFQVNMPGMIKVYRQALWYNYLTGQVYKQFNASCPIIPLGKDYEAKYSITIALMLSRDFIFNNAFGSEIYKDFYIHAQLKSEKLYNQLESRYDIIDSYYKFIKTEDDL